LIGLIAIELVDRNGKEVSVSGLQTGLKSFASLVFHTPPLTVAAQIIFAFSGSTAMLAMAPPATWFGFGITELNSPSIGPGPCSAQIPEGTNRSSSRSRAKDRRRSL